MEKDQLFKLLDDFNIETPSWGFADTGTRFGKFLQPAAASTIEEKLAGRRARSTSSPAAARPWPCTCCGTSRAASTRRRRPTSPQKNGVQHRRDQPQPLPGPVLQVRLASARPDERAAEPRPPAHARLDRRSAKAVGSDLLSLWFADGTNYPGQDDIVARKHRMHGALRAVARGHAARA